MRPTLRNAFLLFVAVLAVVNVGNYIVVSGAFHNVDESSNAVLTTQQVLQASTAFMRHMVDAETGQRGFLLTGDPAYLQPYSSGKTEALQDYGRLLQLTRNNAAQHERVRAMERPALAKLSELERTIELHTSGEHERALELVRNNTGQHLMVEIRAQIAEFAAREAKLLRVREEASARAWQSALGWYAGTSLLVSVLALLAFWQLRTRVLQPVEDLADRLERFNADDSVQPPTAANAMQEVKRLINAFAKMSASLQDKQMALRETAQAAADVAREYEVLYNEAPCGYHSIDGSGTIRLMNDTELRWLGYSSGEVINEKTVLDLLAPQSRPIYLAQYPVFLREGFISDLEVSFQRKDGAEFPVLINATAQFNEQGELVSSRAVVLEHGRLRQERETLRAVLAAAPMAVRVATLSHNRVLFMNRAFCDLVQLNEADARRMDVSKNYVDPQVFGSIRSALGRGEMVLNRLVELHLPHKPDSPHVWALGSYMLIEYEGQRAALAWLYDVTHLHQATLAAEAASQAKSDFLANMSHEIRTPLNAMLGLAYLLEQTPLQEQQRMQVTKLRVAGQTLLGLLNDILDLAKIEAGELSVERAPFSLNKLLEELYTVQISAAEAKGLRLEISQVTDSRARGLPDPALDVLLGDAQHLRQILLNLLNNAVKFTERGSVRLVVQRAAAENNELPEGQVRLLFKVRDSGIGIDPDIVPKLFTRFTQADSSTTRRFGGTGLGLSIVKQLSLHMGGRVWVESEHGVGSTFFVELPFEIASEADRTALGMRASPLEVIIAEDDQTQRETLAAMARSFGWRVEEVNNGADLVERVTARMAVGQSPDCLIVDWNMPAMDGLGALQRLAATLGADNVPSAVVVTAYETVELREHVELPDSVLLKQVDSSELFNVVNAAVIKRSGRSNLVLEGSSVDRAPVTWLPDVHVLLVDDSDINLEVAGSILRRQGAVVSTVTNGQAALNWLRDPKNRADVVLMDVQMPVMDGNTAVRELRKDERFAKLPVIALTAGALLRERMKALEAGMNDFLTKPFEPDNIVRVVRQQVERTRGAALGTVARAQAAAGSGNAWPEIEGVDIADARARLSDNFEMFVSGLRRMLQEFGDLQIPPAVPDMPDAHAALLARMHKLAGSAGVLGARHIQHCAKTIEQRLRARDPKLLKEEELRGLLVDLGQHFVALARAAAPHLEAADQAKQQHDARAQESAGALDDAELATLREQLEQNDFGVLATMKRLAPALRTAMPESRYRMLEQAVNALDFKSALQALEGVGSAPPRASSSSG